MDGPMFGVCCREYASSAWACETGEGDVDVSGK